MDTGLQDQCVLITGASGGIGLPTAEAFAAEGARLVLHGHRHMEPLHALRSRLSVPSVVLSADLRDETQVERLFADALQFAPRIDVVVANAGAWVKDAIPLHEMTHAQWDETLAADLTSVFLTCRAFLRHLAATPRASAALVLVGSTAAIFGEADHADYAAAKAAVTYGLMLSLKNEIVRLAPRGRVNAVCPGWTRTASAADQLAGSDVLRRVQATIALNKIATPQDVAAAIVFLASERLAGHISGVVLPVAGGMEGRLLHP
ncbi:MAG TPA: SDR family oxidoreductase [Phycisphaerae bacterium]|nr:SDR family oxidoreductase [Phycisphaerae bacterium]HPM23495.1 SDR family oxidoreductase [Phycisphaerae bacterium]HQL54653.1 SDR family oxidoreductase [Phycisphaerae bacterium]